MQKTIVALYDDTQHARQAVQELVDKGISRDHISLMANNARGQFSETSTSAAGVENISTSNAADGASVGAGIGAAMGGIGGLLVGLGALVIPGIGPVLAAGPLAAALGGVAGAGAGAIAGGAAGGVLGALTDIGISDEQAGYYAEGIRRGGTLLTVETEDNLASQAVDIMNRHSPVDVRTRASEWRTAGWTNFDPAGSIYSGTDTRTERTPGEYYTGSDIDVNPDVTRAPATDRDREVEDSRGNFVSGTGGSLSDVPRSTMSSEPFSGDTMRGSGYGMGTGGMDTSSTDRTLENKIDPFEAHTFDYYDSSFRSDFETNYARSGYAYNQYQPAYRYGYDLARNDQYRGWDWNQLEPEARAQWLESHPDNAWEDFKDSVRYAWNEVRNQFRSM